MFVTDLSVIVLQPYTYDAARIKAGIEKAGVRVTSQYPSTNEEARKNRSLVSADLMRRQDGQTQPAPNTESIAPAAALALRNLEGYEQMQRDQEGNATAFCLLHIAASLRSLPGRKAVIFFSEGLVLPPNVQRVFQSVVNEANRSNVSFYSVDVAGLRTESKTSETRKEINSRSEVRMSQVGSTSESMADD